MPLTIRRAFEGEAHVLTALAMQSKAHWGYSPEVLEGWRRELTLTAEDIRAKVVFVVELDEAIAGFYSLVPGATAWELDNLWVAPASMHRGVGRALVTHARAHAAQGGAAEVTVDSDPNAEAFYAACGAVRRGEMGAPIASDPKRVRPQLAFTTFPYFAYGSNMCTPRLRARTPSARAVATGLVAGRRLTFDKVSGDGSGKCDACSGGTDGDRVHGVVFEIAFAEKPTLDRAEGLGAGYDDEIVEVAAPAGTLHAVSYVATRKNAALSPYHWYKRLVLAGASEHKLPAEYVSRIETIPSVEDPDDARRAENDRLLAMIEEPSHEHVS